MAVFLNSNGVKKYLTGNKIAEILQLIAMVVHPDLTDKELKKFFSHSGRVWALVLLDEAGMTPDFMKSHLRWMGESYRLYLWDTSTLQYKHVDALKKESDKIHDSLDAIATSSLMPYLSTIVRPTKVGNVVMAGIGSRQHPHTPQSHLDTGNTNSK